MENEKECCGQINGINVEIKNMKEDIKELKEDRKIQTETLIALKENIAVLTTLMDKVNERNNKQDEKLDEIAKEVHKLSQNNDEYESDNGHKDINKNLLIAILILVGFILGKADVIVGLFK